MILSSIHTICTLLYTAPIARISFPGFRGRGRRGPLPRGDALGGEPGRRARRRPPHRIAKLAKLAKLAKQILY